ncbi:MAG: alpha/beta hydrolase [Saprospiraceae bacterium]|nr:alpha/beta hydrolase [Saprospiraceae bacterium]
MKKLKYALLIGMALMLPAAGFLIHFVAPYAIIKPYRSHLALTPEDLGLRSEALTLVVEDSIALKGYHIQANTDTTKAVIILVHGIGGCKEHFLEFAAALANLGYASVLFDNRAQGQSGGQYCTFGFYEKRDISAIVDTIRQGTPNLKIGIWGNSLGGAIAMQALEADERIAFGVVESTFADLGQIVFDYKKRYLKGLGIRFLSDYALNRAAAIAHFNPAAVCPLKSAENIEQPVLIAHGDADQAISAAYGKLLYQHLKSAEKELVIVPGGGHYDLGRTGGATYKNRLLGFLEKCLQG